MVSCELTSGPRVVFSAYTKARGREPWVTDGTAAGTVMLGDLRPGPDSSAPILGKDICLDGKVYFSATIASRVSELWVSDGTPAGTTRVIDASKVQGIWPTYINLAGIVPVKTSNGLLVTIGS